MVRIVNRTGPLAAAIAIAIALLGVGCSAPASVSPESTRAEPATTAPPATGSATIAEVWEVIGCSEDDPLGTRGMIDTPTPPKPPIIHDGSCQPYEDGERAYFFEFASAEDAASAVDDGVVEVGSTDHAFVDGAVLILATDAVTAGKFDDLFTRIE